MKMFINGKRVESPVMKPVISPYSGEVVDEVPDAATEHIEEALAAAEKAAVTMSKLTAYERYDILLRAADLLAERSEDFAKTISLEVGKPFCEGRGEVSRMPDIMRLCAFEGSQLRGETLPINSQVGIRGKMGFTLRVPCGVVVAITPFNFPLSMAVHKAGPAIAAGNSVILKPASQTPLATLKFTELLLEAGIPEGGIQCITGSGFRIGPILCADPRVRMVTFTGSGDVGEDITRVAGIKKLALELGSNCPLIVMSDTDLEHVAAATAVGGYLNAGQVCISTQRVLVQREIYSDFLDILKTVAEEIKVGDPFDEGVKLSAMVSEKEAIRVEEWVDEAVQDGAHIVTGGTREGAVYAPTVVADVKPQMRISKDELFGPVLAVTPFKDMDEAMALANDSSYGLSSGIFTNNVNEAMRFAYETQTGNVMVNWTPTYRGDCTPYGGLKDSGIGREGPRYMVEEMTELKTVIFHGIDS